MAIAKKDNLAIELPRLDIRMMDVIVVGDSPLIVHAWDQKQKLAMLSKQMKKPAGAKEKRDPVADFEASLYRLADGGYGFPSVGFKNAAVTACTSVAGITKMSARQAFHIIGEDVDVKGAFDGTRARHNLVRIEGGAPVMREDPVKIGMGNADLRYRGEFTEWWARLLVRYNGNVLSEEQLLNILNVAGFAVGCGEWRPERDGMSGMFHVASEQDIARLEAASQSIAA